MRLWTKRFQRNSLKKLVPAVGREPRAPGESMQLQAISYMPQEDDGASELNHPEEIFWVVFPANDDATKVMKPGEQAFHFPATPVAAQNTPVLRGLAVSNS
jgi:hypothetical protein